MRRHRGVTVVETLPGVVCVLLLAAAVLAAASRNRQEAYTAGCASHLQRIAERFPTYLAETGGFYPPSYVFPINPAGDYDLASQNASAPYGVAHWSWLMFGDEALNTDLFQCPAMQDGGAPRTNPGPLPWNWQAGQVDWNGHTRPSEYEDKQAPWLAYTANSAILPQNGFTSAMSGGPRVSVLVAQSALSSPGDTIVVTEFVDNWRGLGWPDAGGLVSKSHRPINPFYHVGFGLYEYAPPLNTPGFIYGYPLDQTKYGLLPTATVLQRWNMLVPGSGVTPTNAVGRHHPGGDDQFEGTAHFLFADGSVRRRTILQTLRDREWGDRFYSLNGENQILNMEPLP